MTRPFRYLRLEHALEIADQLGVPEVRDIGLLDAAIHRPAASAFGQDAYPTLLDKAAALFESLVRNHPLVDGNKRLAWTMTVVFLGFNDVELTRPTDDDVYTFVVAAAAGEQALPDIRGFLAAMVADG